MSGIGAMSSGTWASSGSGWPSRTRAEGGVGGRRPKLSALQRAELVRGVRAGRYSLAQAARLFGVHPATVSRLMAAQKS